MLLYYMAVFTKYISYGSYVLLVPDTYYILTYLTMQPNILPILFCRLFAES